MSQLINSNLLIVAIVSCELAQKQVYLVHSFIQIMIHELMHHYSKCSLLGQIFFKSDTGNWFVFNYLHTF